MIYTFWDGLLISRFFETDINNLAYPLIKKGLEEGRSIDTQIKLYKHFLDTIKDRKLKRRRINRTDHNFALYCIMALIKLKVIEEDEPLNGLYYSPKRKRT
jgi:hypothetical protein